MTIKPGYEFGYMIGANEGFASRYAASLTAATGLPARLEAVTRPSGYLRRDVPGFRVRVGSSYLADLMRQYVSGDPHHMRQRFPRVVLRDRETSEGFLDGYTDGDGFRPATWRGRLLVSANVPFCQRRAEGPKPFTLYSYRLHPYPDFLVNGYLARQGW
ncbi:hypothetical protein ACWGI9_07030 [Streptomyces sp. NPDC054833]